jgi:hypothetical protein
MTVYTPASTTRTFSLRDGLASTVDTEVKP